MAGWLRGSGFEFSRLEAKLTVIGSIMPSTTANLGNRRFSLPGGMFLVIDPLS
jgi:hypothetical protein